MTEQKQWSLEEIRSLIGKTIEQTLVVDLSMLRAFCQCIDESDPKWFEPVAPGFFTSVIMSGGYSSLGVPTPYKRTVAAGADWEFLKPVSTGDVITTTHQFSEIQDKTSEKGPRAILVFKSTHRNQKGEIVGISTTNVMSY